MMADHSRVDDRLIQALMNPALYDHPVESFQRIETHISWLLLTGPFAYKIKKPVNLGFLDFSSIDRRRYYCEEELRLNRRLAAPLYCAVVPITGTADQPRLGGEGAAIDYAVKMRQFPQEAQLDRLLDAGRLDAARLDELSVELAAFHDRADRASSDGPFGSPARNRCSSTRSGSPSRPDDEVLNGRRHRAFASALSMTGLRIVFTAKVEPLTL